MTTPTTVDSDARGRGRADGRSDVDEDDDAAPTSQGVDDVEAEDGEDGGLKK